MNRISKLLVICCTVALVSGCGSNDTKIEEFNLAYEEMRRTMKDFRAGNLSAELAFHEVRNAFITLDSNLKFITPEAGGRYTIKKQNEAMRNLRELFSAITDDITSIEQFDKRVEHYNVPFGLWTPLTTREVALHKEKIAIKYLVKKGAEIKKQVDPEWFRGHEIVTWLKLERSSVDDGDLEQLKCLISLTMLELDGRISVEGVRELQKLLSDCHVSPGRKMPPK